LVIERQNRKLASGGGITEKKGREFMRGKKLKDAEGRKLEKVPAEEHAAVTGEEKMKKKPKYSNRQNQYRV